MKDGSLSLLSSGHFSAIAHDPTETLCAFLNDHSIQKVTAMAHRIVHGGSRLTAPCVLDHAVETEIRRLAPLGGTQAILFGGGVGEHAPPVRERILAGMSRLGVVLDANANRAAIGTEALISRRGSEAEVWVIPVDEARILAEEAVALVRPPATVSCKEGKS